MSSLTLFAAISNWIQPLWIVATGGAAALGGLIVAYFALKLVFPKVAAIARTTAKEGRSQPLFWVELGLGTVALLLLTIMPYNTFGDDLKALKESGLEVILVLGIFSAVWSASASIAEELDGRTALTLLSKPISRRQFVIGKFLGVLVPVFLLFVVLGMLYLAAVSFKVTFDAQESHVVATVEQCQHEMLHVVPAVVLKFLETVIFTAISVAISTRLPMVPNLVICVAIYVLGHLVPLVVQSSAGRLEIVAFMGQFFATVLPVLDHFSVPAAVAAGRDVPLDYLGWALAYCLLYSTIAMLVALVMFEDRDLA